MIIDILDNADRYYSLNPLFKKAFQYLKKTDFSKLEDGRIELVPKELSVIIASDDINSSLSKKLEVHKRYIDIQYTFEGEFEIGYKPLQLCNYAESDFNVEKDIQFFKDKPSFYSLLRKGYFAILFPEDAHSPMPPSEFVKKVVLKVAVKN